MPSPLDEARKARAALLARDRALQTDLLRAYGTSWKAIQEQLDRINREIAEARARGEKVSTGWLIQRGRLESLQRGVEAEIRVFVDTAHRTITQAQLDEVLNGQADASKLVRASLGKPPIGTTFPLSAPFAAAHEIVGFSAKGMPLGGLLAELPSDAGRAVRSSLIRSVVLGENPRSTARRIRTALGGNAARALTIARTEQLRAYREATRQSYAANPAVKEWAWLASPDACAVCLAMSGEIFDTEDGLDSHPNCRCAMVPVTKSWAELGFSGIRETSWQPRSGEEVFAGFDAAKQAKILGPGKFAAYRDGRIKLRDLVRVTHSRRFGRGRAEKSLKDALA